MRLTLIVRLDGVSTARSGWISVRRGLRPAALILVLAGLFGMHGLDGHDAVAIRGAHQATMGEMPVGPTTTDPVLGGHGQPDIEAVSASGAGGMDMGMGMAMCVGILAGALIALRLLLGGRVRPVLWVLARQARQARAVLEHPGRGPDPPSLVALSIQRC